MGRLLAAVDISVIKLPLEWQQDPYQGDRAVLGRSREKSPIEKAKQNRRVGKTPGLLDLDRTCPWCLGAFVVSIAGDSKSLQEELRVHY